jgi:ribosomal protein S17E
MNGKQLVAGTYYYVIDPKNGRQKIAGYVTIFK